MVERRKDTLIRLLPRHNTLYTSQNRTVLATGLDGFISPEPERGLFVYETRMLSRYRYFIDHAQPEMVAHSNIRQHSWMGYYILTPPGFRFPDQDRGSGMVRQSSEFTLELRLSRFISDGMHEDIDLTNFTQQETSFDLEIEVDADFADVIETQGERLQQGQLTRAWQEAEENVWELIFDYQSEHSYEHQGEAGTAAIHRRLSIKIEDAGSPPSYRDGCIHFPVRLGSQETWHACLTMIPSIDGNLLAPEDEHTTLYGNQTKFDRLRKGFLERAATFSTPESSGLSYEVMRVLEQAKNDLIALRLYDLDHGEQAWVMAAGIPIYVALFGRDTLTAAWQAALISPEMLRGVPIELARWQGTKIDDWRDEQPGRMLHEAHTGPVETLNINPRQRYYGSITTSDFYPVVVSELWHWTGDREAVYPLIEPMLKALKWLDDYSDLDGDGFYEYKTRSSQGNRNQAWKDSWDGIVYEDGQFVEPPIATCEEQGFSYLAKLRASEILWWFDRKDEARRMFAEAGELKKRFNEAFWMEDLGFYALGLDSQKRPIKSITSNPGHLLATAIADTEHVSQTADRLMADDLFSGWGIRTLSSDHPVYNPYSYHRGSVWPVEQATFTIGFMRYGLHEKVDQLCRALFEAAALFDYHRLPEVFSGHPRDEQHPFPAFYPRSNSPQAWSASAAFNFIQSILGLYPYAPLHLLLVDPHLPDWLPEFTIHHLQVSNAFLDIRFSRKENGDSVYEVLDQQGSLHVIRQPSPWSLTADLPERVYDFLESLLPGK